MRNTAEPFWPTGRGWPRPVLQSRDYRKPRGLTTDWANLSSRPVSCAETFPSCQTSVTVLSTLPRPSLILFPHTRALMAHSRPKLDTLHLIGSYNPRTRQSGKRVAITTERTTGAVGVMCTTRKIARRTPFALDASSITTARLCSKQVVFPPSAEPNTCHLAEAQRHLLAFLQTASLFWRFPMKKKNKNGSSGGTLGLATQPLAFW